MRCACRRLSASLSRYRLLPETVEDLSMQVDEVICPLIPEWMMSIGYWYLDFSQTSDEEVIDLMQRAWQRELPGASRTEHRDA